MTVLRLPPGKEYTGAPVPEGLFETEWAAEVFETGTKCEDGWTATVRLIDPRLEHHTDQRLSRLFGGEPPGPFRYRVKPATYLLGVTRDERFRTGNFCYIWVRTKVPLPWAPGDAAKPDRIRAPQELEGFHRGRIVAITKADEKGVRQVRAIFEDVTIAEHRFPHVRAFHGHEPKTEYFVTRTDDAVVEAWDDITAAARNLGRKAANWFDGLVDHWD